jgi:hypothetical protein
MYPKSILIVLAVFSAMSAAPSALSASIADSAEQQPERNRQAAPKAKAETGSMTGCVDQQDGKYVLVDDRSLSPVADLEAEGFPTEGFAKHVGNKVTVRGTVNSNGPRPLVKVRSIQKVSDGCKGQQQ